MKIKTVNIDNWQSPGEDWWAGVEAFPDLPLIEATISLTLSCDEYKELLSKDRHPFVQPTIRETPP
jgi:hypothetical protein